MYGMGNYGAASEFREARHDFREARQETGEARQHFAEAREQFQEAREDFSHGNIWGGLIRLRIFRQAHVFEGNTEGRTKILDAILHHGLALLLNRASKECQGGHRLGIGFAALLQKLFLIHCWPS